MASAEEEYEKVARDLASRPGVKRGKMFGMPGMKLGKTAFAGLFGKDMVFKLGEGTDAYKKAMELEGATIWDPSGRNRPFKDWVQVPTVNAAQWGLLADYAFQKAVEQQGLTK